MIAYSQALQSIAATLTIKDGYSLGNRVKIGLSFINGYAIAIHAHGSYRFTSSQYSDQSEMLYYLNNHTKVFNSSVFSIDQELDQEFVDGLPIG
jgi:hypothetical protein